MAKSYKCVAGDRIDLIVLDHYGSLGMLSKVIASNVHILSKIPLILEIGTTLVLPDMPKTEIAKVKKSGELW